MNSVKRIDKIKDDLANERTFLAWMRTSISMIVFGFVVAKFGLTLRAFLLLQNHRMKEGNSSLNIGVGFMVIGVLMALAALILFCSNF